MAKKRAAKNKKLSNRAVNNKINVVKPSNNIKNVNQEKLLGSKVKGLNNMGNTCYFNSMLQMILNCPGFMEELKQYCNNDKKIIFKQNNENFELILKQKDVSQVEKELINLWESDASSCTPGFFRAALLKNDIFLIHFGNNREHDSHEAFLAVINIIKEAQIRRIQGAILDKFQCRNSIDHLTEDMRAEVTAMSSKLDRYTLIHVYFGIGFGSMFSCSVCDGNKMSYDDGFHVSPVFSQSNIESGNPTCQKNEENQDSDEGTTFISTNNGNTTKKLSKHQLKKQKRMERKSGRKNRKKDITKENNGESGDEGEKEEECETVVEKEEFCELDLEKKRLSGGFEVIGEVTKAEEGECEAKKESRLNKIDEENVIKEENNKELNKGDLIIEEDDEEEFVDCHEELANVEADEQGDSIKLGEYNIVMHKFLALETEADEGADEIVEEDKNIVTKLMSGCEIRDKSSTNTNSCNSLSVEDNLSGCSELLGSDIGEQEDTVVVCSELLGSDTCEQEDTVGVSDVTGNEEEIEVIEDGSDVIEGDEASNDHNENMYIDYTEHSVVEGKERSNLDNEVMESQQNFLLFMGNEKMLFEGETDLDRALKKFIHPSSIDNVQCEYKCKIPQPHIRRDILIRAPPILPIYISRFRMFQKKVSNKRSNSATKDNFVYSYPLYLNLSSQTSHLANQTQQPIIYRLYGVIVHLGAGIDSGHYLSYVSKPIKSANPVISGVSNNIQASLCHSYKTKKNAGDDNMDMSVINEDNTCVIAELLSSENEKLEWYLCNDSHISRVTQQEVLTRQAFMLFYSRIL